VAIVTGASRGIGAAIARGLAECGARVVISSRKQDAVDVVAAQLTGAGHDVRAIAAHVGRLEDVARLVDETVAAFGRIDIVVNNAATNPVFGPVLDVDAGVFEKIMNVNVRGPLEFCKLAHPHMAAQGGGSVVNISSVGGIKPEPMLGVYSVSKAALISLSKVLASEWGRDGIRVNAICPGLVQTTFSAALWQNEAIVGEFLSRVPLGKMASAEEIVPLALFLASPASAYCTGAVYTIDGGLTI
jgi:NAD(P)-dependent dehydrogenase (short-subunit alcohol dehydrogenase family)